MVMFSETLWKLWPEIFFSRGYPEIFFLISKFLKKEGPKRLKFVSQPIFFVKNWLVTPETSPCVMPGQKGNDLKLGWRSSEYYLKNHQTLRNET